MHRRLIFALALTLAAICGCSGSLEPVSTAAAASSTSPATSDAIFARAFKDRATHLQVQGHGTVIKLLSDDNEGSRHQRFIVRLNSGQTLLIAHNIDLAPRIAQLREGDVVSFNGEYEWNSKGGTVHWTHHDPAARHPAGWVKHGGRTFQ